MKLTQCKLKKLLDYNAETGVFIWRERDVNLFLHCENPARICNSWNTKYAGCVAGHKVKKKSGLFYISIALGETAIGNVKKYQAHRLAWLYITGRFPEFQIDHIDGDGTNNKWLNLRDATNQENHKNVKRHCDNTSGYTGISLDKKSGKWDVRVQLNGKPVFRKLFLDIKDAVYARNREWKKHGFHKNHGR